MNENMFRRPCRRARGELPAEVGELSWYDHGPGWYGTEFMLMRAVLNHTLVFHRDGERHVYVTFFPHARVSCPPSEDGPFTAVVAVLGPCRGSFCTVGYPTLREARDAADELALELGWPPWRKTKRCPAKPAARRPPPAVLAHLARPAQLGLFDETPPRP